MAFRLIKTPRFETYDRIAPAKLRDELKGRSVLVTGGGVGIGAAMARSFAEAGVNNIHISGRTEKTLQETAEELRKSFPDTRVDYHIADIASPADVKRLFEEIQEPVDILVNNAGMMNKAMKFIDMDIRDWWRTLEVNVFGTAQVIQTYLRQRRDAAAKAGGPLPQAVVITVNSGAALYWPIPNQTGYGPSKAALARLTELLPLEVAASDVRFVSLHPGSIATGMIEEQDPVAIGPLSDIKLPADFAVWLTSREADFLAGRFAWANWDVDELVGKKQEIEEKDLLKTDLREERVERGFVPGGN